LSKMTDAYNGAEIENDEDALEIKITDQATLETTTSFILKETRDQLIEADPDLESVFIHD
jgi:hypothetical protein